MDSVGIGPGSMKSSERYRRWFDQSPQELFTTFGQVSGSEQTRRIREHCLHFGCVALFGVLRDDGRSVWHTLINTNTGSRITNAAATRVYGWSESLRESDFERIVAGYYEVDRDLVKRQVRCAAGIADIVTEREVVEVKLRGRGANFQPFGQVLAYRAAINKSLDAVVVVESCEPRFAANAELLGIRLITIRERE